MKIATEGAKLTKKSIEMHGEEEIIRGISERTAREIPPDECLVRLSHVCLSPTPYTQRERGTKKRSPKAPQF